MANTALSILSLRKKVSSDEWAVRVDLAACYRLVARYAAHARGKGARYTRSHPPRRLMTVIDYRDRASASAAEYAVKQLSAAEKRAYALLLALGGTAADAD